MFLNLLDIGKKIRLDVSVDISTNLYILLHLTFESLHMSNYQSFVLTGSD